MLAKTIIIFQFQIPKWLSSCWCLTGLQKKRNDNGTNLLIVSVNDQVRAELLELIQFKKIYETPLNEELPGEWI